jgi:hypothetical protein
MSKKQDKIIKEEKKEDYKSIKKITMDKPKRIVLISDISGESESIIPWGLNLGKHTGSEVDILHIIDPRDKQGVESPVSDSQSITPGDKANPGGDPEKRKRQS